MLAYVAGMDAKQAIATSLLVVGPTSAVGAVSHARAGRVQWRTALLFGATAMAAPTAADTWPSSSRAGCCSSASR